MSELVRGPVAGEHGGGGVITGQVKRDGQLLAGGAYGGPPIVWDLAHLHRSLAEMGLDW